MRSGLQSFYFHARSRFARSTIPEEKWGTTRSLVYYQRCVLIGLATIRLYVIGKSNEKRGLFGGEKGLKSSVN